MGVCVTSSNAGHVVNVADTDQPFPAGVAQVPFFGLELRGSPRTASVTTRLFGAAIVDGVCGWLGGPRREASGRT
jgi:hypothetical protein